VSLPLDLEEDLDPSETLIPAQVNDPRGEQRYAPQMLTMFLLYNYCAGMVSSCRKKRSCHDDLAYRGLTGNEQLDNRRISDCRHRNSDALKAYSFSSCGCAR